MGRVRLRPGSARPRRRHGHLLLLLYTESEAGPRSDVLHADLLKLDLLEAGLEQPPGSTHNLLDDADAADHLNGPVPGGSCRLRDRRFDANALLPMSTAPVAATRAFMYAVPWSAARSGWRRSTLPL